MKFTWHSNAPWAATGYGNQTKIFVPRLKALGHEIAVVAFYGLEGGSINWGGVPIYPKGKDPYGQDVLGAHAGHYGTNVVISLLDAWVFQPQMFPSTLWIPWFPVDMDPLPPPVLDKVKKAFDRIVFSKYAVEKVREAGLEAHYVPHGVESNIFKPGDQMQARDFLRLPKDKFIVGMVAANKGTPSRKAFTYQLKAFAEFKKKHDDVCLYLHTNKGEHGENQGINIPEYLSYLGLSYGVLAAEDCSNVDVMFPHQYLMNFGMLNDDYMAAAYNAMDVHLLVSMGEGFGIPILEAQSCGVPVIVGDWTAMSEICFSGWRIPLSEAHGWWTPLAAHQFAPHEGPITDALEQAYRVKGNQDYRKRARKGALAYDADKVTEKYWKPVLEKIEQDAKIWSPSS